MRKSIVPVGKAAPSAPEFMTARDAASYLGISAGWLAIMRCRGQGPAFHRLGKRMGIRYRLSTLEKWAAAREVETT